MGGASVNSDGWWSFTQADLTECSNLKGPVTLKITSPSHVEFKNSMDKVAGDTFDDVITEFK